MNEASDHRPQALISSSDRPLDEASETAPIQNECDRYLEQSIPKAQQALQRTLLNWERVSG